MSRNSRQISRTPPALRRWLTRQEVIEEFPVAYSTLAAVPAAVLPCIPLGKSRVYDRFDLEPLFERLKSIRLADLTRKYVLGAVDDQLEELRRQARQTAGLPPLPQEPRSPTITPLRGPGRPARPVIRDDRPRSRRRGQLGKGEAAGAPEPQAAEMPDEPCQRGLPRKGEVRDPERPQKAPLIAADVDASV